MLKVIVRQITEGRRLDNRSQPIRVYVFSFMVGDHGPFSLEFSPEEVQSGAAHQKLNEFAAQLERNLTF